MEAKDRPQLYLSSSPRPEITHAVPKYPNAVVDVEKIAVERRPAIPTMTSKRDEMSSERGMGELFYLSSPVRNRHLLLACLLRQQEA